MPKKPKADTSWITEDMLDALAWRESSHRPDITNPESGAAGMYQWMPLFWKEGAEVGFGVDKGPFDPFDPVESRKRTKMYLEGMQKHYPDWDPTEVLMAYNWGHGNVRKLKSGELSMEDYMAQGEWEKRKAAEAMSYAPKILQHLQNKPWMENLDETGLEPTI